VLAEPWAELKNDQKSRGKNAAVLAGVGASCQLLATITQKKI
jgi:hypothetical protein